MSASLIMRRRLFGHWAKGNHGDRAVAHLPNVRAITAEAEKSREVWNWKRAATVVTDYFTLFSLTIYSVSVPSSSTNSPRVARPFPAVCQNATYLVRLDSYIYFCAQKKKICVRTYQSWPMIFRLALLFCSLPIILKCLGSPDKCVTRKNDEDVFKHCCRHTFRL